MHHAHRSIRVSCPGARASSTAAKPALKALGKWEIPKPVPDSASSKPSPNFSKWGLPSTPPVRPTASPRNGQRTSKWTRESNNRPSYTPINNSSTSTSSAPNSASLSKWGLGSKTDPSSSSPRTRDAPPQFHRDSQIGARVSSDIVPPSKSGFVATSEHDSIDDALQSIQQEEGDVEVDDAEEVLYRKTEGLSDVPPLIQPSRAFAPRNHKEGRPAKTARTYKERGSLVSLLGGDIAIPGYSRSRTTPGAAKVVKRDKKSKHRAVKRTNPDIFIPSVVSVVNLARLLNVRLDRLQRKMAQAGMGEESSHDHMLTSEYASLLAMEFNRNPIVNDEAAFDIYPTPPPADKSTLPPRPPVVTIMGHVDHGKTTLLDTLRSSSVAKGEAGGITQHIGAFSVPVPATSGEGKGTITFLDTPGHAAFSAMRARGAGVTDVVVLVVAADDGIMPQTREVLELVKKDTGKIGLVVAINKVDKPGVDVSKIETSLLAENVQLETFGGDVPAVHVSGLTGQGLDQLVETISVVAEMQDLRAEQQGIAQGYVLESKVQKGLGPVATVLLLRGELKPGSQLICGTTSAKVRLIQDPSGKALKVMQPGMAAVISGWKELPGAGDEVLQGSESDVKRAVTNRIRKADIESTMNDMEAINTSRKEERARREVEDRQDGRKGSVEEEVEEKSQKKELKLVIKGDVSGSVEAVAGALQGIGNNIAGVKVVATGVGDVTESDVMRAKAIDGMIVAFSVNTPRPVEATAAGQSVPIVSSTIIYRLMDKIKEEVIKLLPVVIERRVTGEASVLQVFDIHLKGKKILKVAGCRVTNGLVEKNKMARVVRNGETVHGGRIETFKHLKKDITEAAKGLECGIGLENFEDLRQGDMIQMYQEIEKPGNL